MAKNEGFGAMPIALKILFVLLSVWAIMTLFALGSASQVGFPLLGYMITGIAGTILMVVLGVVIPLGILFCLWTRNDCALKCGVGYFIFFIVNTGVAYLRFPEQFALQSTIIPIVLSALFMGLLISSRDYFSEKKK